MKNSKDMQKNKELYAGKAKTIYATEDPNRVILHFRDDITAFNAVKKANLMDKGKVNNRFNAFIMQHLSETGIKTHFEKLLNDNETQVKHLQMIPVECVIRNIAAGSLCRRLGIKEGIQLAPPIFEFYLKDDALGDPPINISHILSFDWATRYETARMQELTQQVNRVLWPLFAEAGMLLVDYKLEFGRYHGALLLGDEFTPDSCRIWDTKTRTILDKDRFRKDLGGVIAAYQQVAERLGIQL